MPSRVPFLVLLLLAVLLPLPAASTLVGLEDGEAILQGLEGLPSRQFVETIGRDPEAAARLATTVFTIWTDQASYRVRAYLDLGRLQVLLGQYPEAEASFLAALAASPDLEAAKAGLVGTRARARAAAGAQPSLPYGNQLLRAEPLPVPGADDLWVVLSATVRQGKPLTRYTSVTIQVFHDNGTDFQELASDLVSAPGPDSAPAHSVALHIHDLTGDGHAEVVVCLGNLEVASRPSCARIYAHSLLPLQTVLSVESSSPIWIESLNRSQSYNVGVTCAIGWHIPPAEQPRWTDIYGWSTRAGRFQVANARFPLSFREWPARLQKVLIRHPDDWQIVQHLALSQLLTGHPADATSSYSRALSLAERALREPLTADRQAFVEEQVQAMRRQIEGLQEARPR